MYKTQLERKKANLSNLQERTQKIVLRREIKKVVKEQILFERKKQQLNEGILSSLLDIGQIGLSFLGTAGDAAFGAGAIADAANAAIHFTRALAGGDRIHFLYGLLSLISVVPGVGDLLGKPIELIVRLGRAAGSETAIARNVGRIANFIGVNQAGIISSVNGAQQYVRANRTNIESALKTAHDRAAGRGNRPTRGRRPRTMTETSSTDNESIVNFILNNQTLQNLFANPDSFGRIVRGIDGAFDQIMSILNAFTEISGEERTELTNITDTPPEDLAAAVERLNESKVERVSLKVLF